MSHGSKSLKLELYPSDYPGLTPVLKGNDWRGYKAFCFDIYNPENQEIRLVIRIDDLEDYPNHEERYNRSFILQPGMNHMSIALDTLVTSGTYRKLNLGNIHKVFIFMARPERKVILYVDYIRLT